MWINACWPRSVFGSSWPDASSSAGVCRLGRLRLCHPPARNTRRGLPVARNERWTSVPAIGTLRRFQALIALGHTGPQIASCAGLSLRTLRSIGYHGSTTVHAETARKMAAAYEQLCMVRPIGHYANRARSMANRRGWAPPLAWNDIDDPDEQPHGWQYTPVSRAETLAELDQMRAGITTVCETLNITRTALEKWCARHDLTPLYSRLVDREQTRYWRNGGAEGGVA